jgi:hypothetical protein
MVAEQALDIQRFKAVLQKRLTPPALGHAIGVMREGYEWSG